ncbi:MAG: glycosyltransferase family 2 protein [Planctomycetota bacterium]
MRVGVVIVNYRTGDLVVDCLRALAEEIAAGDDFGVVVVDNASGDGSLETVQAAVDEHCWGAWCEVVDAGRNGGFAFGNNVGARRVLAWDRPADAVHFLNPDTYVRPGAVRELTAFLEKHPRAGIVGSRLENPDASVRRGAFRFPGAMSEIESQLWLGPVSRLLSPWVVAPPAPEGDWRPGWVTGASMMVRREALEQVGHFDDAYFLYFEETDLCLRIARAGWEIWQVPASRVVHLVGQSTGVNRKDEKPRPKPAYWYDSRRLYFEKNYGRVRADLIDACRCGAVLVSRVLGAVLGRAGDETITVDGVLSARRRLRSAERAGAGVTKGAAS